MNTFLPYPDFHRSARALDDRRLGKQRVEAYQILRTLLGITSGWQNHPAVCMWRGHERCLAAYGLAMCREWVRRGHADTVEAKIAALAEGLPDSGAPPWLGSERLHRSHRSNLTRKDPDFYRKQWRTGPGHMYWWPVQAAAALNRSRKKPKV